LLADPQRFGEVITNDVIVAKAAREFEQATAKQPPRRLRSLRRRGE
jgi:hypothetical protein